MSQQTLKKKIEEWKGNGIYTKDNKLVHCNVCAKPINHFTNGRFDRTKITRHINGSCHQKKSNETPLRQTLLTTSFNNQESRNQKQAKFNEDIALMFMEANIPFEKLDNLSIINFFRKYLPDYKLPHSTMPPKTICERIYNNKLHDVRNVLMGELVFFQIDETTDTCGRFVVNILAGVLNGIQSKPYLVHTAFIEATNSKTIKQEFLTACQRIWTDGVPFQRLMVVLTDQAGYMKLAFKELKSVFENLKHITCVAHALHRVCECIREEYLFVNDLVSTVKKVLKKSTKNRNIYYQTTKLRLPPNACITRWGTFINAAMFFVEHFSAIKEFAINLNSDSAAAKKLKNLVMNPQVVNELYAIEAFKFIPSQITTLEASGLDIDTQLRVIEEVHAMLDGFAKEKFEKCLNKNPDLEWVRNIKDSTGVDLELKRKLRYLPLVTVDVERSFSIYKNLLTDRRQSLSTDSIIKYLFMQYNTASDVVNGSDNDIVDI